MNIQSDESLFGKVDKKLNISKTKTQLMSTDLDTIDDKSFTKRRGILKIIAKALSLLRSKIEKEKFKYEKTLDFNA